MKTVQEALSHAASPVHRQGDLADEVDGMKGDTIKVLCADDGWPNGGALYGSHKTVVPKCVNGWFSLLMDVKIMVLPTIAVGGERSGMWEA